MSAVPSSRDGELAHARLGVIYFLGKLEVGFSPEASAAELKNKVVTALQGKVGKGRILTAATKVGDAAEGIEKEVNDIARSIQEWLVNRFKISPSTADLAVQHVRYNLPELIKAIKDEVTDGSSELKTIATGLAKAISKTIEAYGLDKARKGVKLESGYPDIIATSIQHSIVNDALEGLRDAAISGAKVLLAAATAGVGEIINKIAGVIELLLKFAVRFCDALELKEVLDDAKNKWDCRNQSDAIYKKEQAPEFAKWFQETVDHSPISAALVITSGVAGHPMNFLQMITDQGSVVTQGQFDKGVTFLNTLQGSASNLVREVKDSMRIFSKDQYVAARLKYAGEIGLVQKEAKSSWRARIFAWTNQPSNKSKAANWVLNKLGYQQSTVLRRI